MDEETGVENKEQAIIPAHQQTVDFYGDPIPVAQTPDGEFYVPLNPLTTFLGLSFGGQRSRVLRDPVLSARTRMVTMARSDGRQRAMLCLPLDLLPGWLFGIETSRVRADLVEKLTRYRAECFRVLWNAFKQDVMPPPPSGTGLSGAQLALEIATAIQHLAQQQVEMETQLGQVAGKQEVIADYLRGYIRDQQQWRQQTESRLGGLEMRLDPANVVTEEQAAEIALAVKNVGKVLETQGERAGYSRVYSEMYRRYRISSYKNLPRARYEEVLAWLHSWFEDLDKAKGTQT